MVGAHFIKCIVSTNRFSMNHELVLSYHSFSQRHSALTHDDDKVWRGTGLADVLCREQELMNRSHLRVCPSERAAIDNAKFAVPALS